MSKAKLIDRPRNCFDCEHSLYIGEGAYWCDECDKTVIADFIIPTAGFNYCDGKRWETQYPVRRSGMSEKKYIEADKFWNRLISVSENDWVGFDTIDEVLSGMPAEPRWIPVTERLPEKRGTYLVTVNDGGIRVAIAQWWYDVDHAKGFFVCDDCYAEDIVAWMPLPDPLQRR